MTPGTQQRKPRNSTKVNLIISLTFHGLLAVVAIYFAAREGLLGKQLKKIAVEMVKEKPPEKPKEPEKPAAETAKTEEAKTPAPAPRPAQETATAPPPTTLDAPPSVAPPALDVASFDFSDGAKNVLTSSDPVQIYKGLVEYALRSRWNRPDEMDDHTFVAEVEVSVDRSGAIGNPTWKKGSGNAKWDDSVRQALAQAKSVSRPPPTNFPPRVVVRFDVVEAEAIAP